MISSQHAESVASLNMPTAKAEKVLVTNLLKHSSLALFTATCIEHGFFHYGGVLKLSPRTFTACQLPHESPENNAVTCLCCYSCCINLYTVSICSPPQWSYYCHSSLSMAQGRHLHISTTAMEFYPPILCDTAHA